MSEGVTFREADRGVSEIIGFVIVFSLVLGTIAVVYTGGFGGLSDARDVEQVNNAERAFEVLGTSLEKMARGQAPNRATEIKLSNARLSTGEARRVSTNTTSLNLSAAAENSRSLRYDPPSDSSIVYEHGAVIRVDGESSTMQREPDYLIDENRTVIRYLEIVGGGQSISGDTTVLVRSQVTRSTLLHSEEHPGDVTFRLRTAPERSDAWLRYLEEETPGSNNCERVDQNDETVTIECVFQTDMLHVALTRIRINLT